ncbi:hypothetical protein ISF_04332 [Cordyceps fumosorosea ARSEF 2679]|uniref:Uncharacterized protein n=1 Tax=Cordyceps fumosorosea (strain ARSEF 2679) TaxID=1081104 RepID=A0A162J7M6_CORFA|nr:hypothetical protein ISF_04332 [Cordyceps fumosorosea ARSEF 2679]OAA64922.1 hypothetical protein ISF_04332 [Cordyceps fumosorosea ARSEF 2679]
MKYAIALLSSILASFALAAGPVPHHAVVKGASSDDAPEADDDNNRTTVVTDKQTVTNWSQCLNQCGGAASNLIGLASCAVSCTYNYPTLGGKPN